jgi:hypothetical protein
MQRSEDFGPRSVGFLRLIEPHGWRLKLYGIRYRGDGVDEALVTAALPLLEARLAESSAGLAHYSVGFAGVHQGKTGNFAFIDWWADENELHHHVYLSHRDRPGSFEYVTPRGLTACVWDLGLIWYERQAWVETVLANPAGPDLDAYLARRMGGDV